MCWLWQFIEEALLLGMLVMRWTSVDGALLRGEFFLLQAHSGARKPQRCWVFSCTQARHSQTGLGFLLVRLPPNCEGDLFSSARSWGRVQKDDWEGLVVELPEGRTDWSLWLLPELSGDVTTPASG